MNSNEIREKLKSIQNKLNNTFFDDEQIEHDAKFIFQNKDGLERSLKDKETFLRIVECDNTRTMYRELSHVVITKDGWKKYFISIKRNEGYYPLMDLAAYGEHEMEMLENIHKIAEVFNTIYRRRYVKSTVEFPTGEILFANYFKNKSTNKYAFEVPEDIEYESEYSINHSFGEQNTMKILSETHGLAYVQLGNTSASVYKINDDKMIVTPPYICHYDEETNIETEIQIPDEWQFLGTIICDVWRVEFIDKGNFDKGNTLPLNSKEYQYNKPFTGKVNPGTWKIINRYHFMEDDYYTKRGEIPIWVEIERNDK